MTRVIVQGISPPSRILRGAGIKGPTLPRKAIGFWVDGALSDDELVRIMEGPIRRGVITIPRNAGRFG